jgi:hypothetical protein
LRRSLFEPVTKVEPKKLREHLFLRGYVTNHEERRRRLEEAAHKFGCTLEEIERSFWADREENEILRGFLAAEHLQSPADADVDVEITRELEITPEELLRSYNLSLAQTLLFDALELSFEVSGSGSGSGNYPPAQQAASPPFQQIFRKIKYLGLMYEAIEELPGQVRVKVDGPASLFKETTKYGSALAKLLPALLRSEKFHLRARIKDKSKVFEFELDHSRSDLFPTVDEEHERKRFDSAVEADFYRRISGVMRDWQVLREPTILRAGPHIFIPDFGFERRGICYYLEIVGFWTPEYLERKLEKLKATEAKLLVAVDRKLNLTEEELGETGKEVFFYERRLPLEPVIRRLLELAEEQNLRELKELEAQIGVEGEKLASRLRDERIALGDLARSFGVGVDAMREFLLREGESEGGGDGGRRRIKIGDYHLVGDLLVSEGLLSKLKAELDGLPEGEGGLDPRGVQELLNRYDLGMDVLELVGYKLERESLLEARVVRFQ